MFLPLVWILPREPLNHLALWKLLLGRLYPMMGTQQNRHGSCPWGRRNEADTLHIVIELNKDWVKHHELQLSIKAWGSLALCRSMERGTPEAVTFEPGSEGWVRITQRKFWCGKSLYIRRSESAWTMTWVPLSLANKTMAVSRPGHWLQ